MIKFNECKLNPNILDQWVRSNVNVLLIGEKGVGKSHHILETFARNNLKHSYFSGATLDPWIHILGIPKAKVMPDGSEKMTFILPENLDEDVEVIFVDEWNRTNKVVRNALLELQQFKSINGRKFPNLRMVWGAVNPKAEDSDDAQYDVDELDPAQLDRFHIIVQLPNEPDIKYFNNKFGAYVGKILVDWWHEQPKDAHKILSPRRLEYVGDCFNKGLDIRYLLPVSANAKELIKKLSVDEETLRINALFQNPTDKDMIEFISKDDNFLKYKSRLAQPHLWKYWKYANKEFAIEEIKTNELFESYAIQQVRLNDAFYKKLVVDISKSNPQANIIKILKILVKENYQIQESVFNSFISDEPNFTTMNDIKKEGSKVASDASDLFSNSHIEWVTNTIPAAYRIDLDMYKSLDTEDRRTAFKKLTTSWTEVDKPYHIINFMMSSLKSMNKNTISSIKMFLPMLGTTCVLAKKYMSDEELAMMSNDISVNKQKLNANRIEDFTNYLTSGRKVCGMSSDFVEKVKKIRNALKVAHGMSVDSDLLNSINI